MGRAVLEPLGAVSHALRRFRRSISLCAPASRSRSSIGRVAGVDALDAGRASWRQSLGLVALDAFAPRGQGVYVPAHDRERNAGPGTDRMNGASGSARLAGSTTSRCSTGGALARALAALNGGGEETRLVGGAVRDLALGERASDFDLATTAPPAEVMRRAARGGIQGRPDRARPRHGDGLRRRRGRSRRRRCATTSRPTGATPRSPSDATSPPTRSGAISPSTRSRSSADGRRARLRSAD